MFNGIGKEDEEEPAGAAAAAVSLPRDQFKGFFSQYSLKREITQLFGC